MPPSRNLKILESNSGGELKNEYLKIQITNLQNESDP